MKSRLEELKEIAEEHDGILYPKHVVEKARDSKSSLHGAFEWDNTKAARKYRLHQARQIISVVVETMEIEGEKKEVTAFVSLRNERDNGGYRQTSNLIKLIDGRKAILDTALWEFSSLRKKYDNLVELSAVFDEIDKVKEEA